MRIIKLTIPFITIIAETREAQRFIMRITKGISGVPFVIVGHSNIITLTKTNVDLGVIVVIGTK